MYTRSIYGVVFILIYCLSYAHSEELPLAGKVLIWAISWNFWNLRDVFVLQSECVSLIFGMSYLLGVVWTIRSFSTSWSKWIGSDHIGGWRWTIKGCWNTSHWIRRHIMFGRNNVRPHVRMHIHVLWGGQIMLQRWSIHVLWRNSVRTLHLLPEKVMVSMKLLK